VLLVHGDRDDVIPPDALFMSAAELGAGGIPCQWRLSAGLGHGIDGPGLLAGGMFLAQSFGVRIRA
jgi:phospholipase/carboxylesterase